VKVALTIVAIAAAIVAYLFKPPASVPPVSAPNVALPRVDVPRGVGEAPVRQRPVASRIVVYVAGDVARPGLYTLAAGARANDALVRAGGPKPDADLVAVNLAEPLDDGAEVVVPRIGEIARGSARRTRVPHRRKRRGHKPSHRESRESRDSDASRAAVDLNMAGEADLARLPGIGPRLAARIIAYRDLNGPFASLDELGDVDGITPRLQDELGSILVVR
jgi:competence protein ComEA